VIDTDKIEALYSRKIDAEHKSLPARAWGSSMDAFLETSPMLSDLQTPVLTLDAAALERNLAIMTAVARDAGVSLAPHGKTTMAPQLWRRLLDAGAWGITLATAWQVQVARSFSVNRVLMANELVDPVGLRWVASELEENQDFEFYCWADSPETVNLMEEALIGSPGRRRIGVMVELGADGGRTGARSQETGLATAAAIADSRHLFLAGVAGWEGVLGHDRTSENIQTIRRFLDGMAEMHRTLRDSGMYSGRSIVTAGGSAYPDLVLECLAPLADGETSVVLRSGSFLIHDDGFYERLSPFRSGQSEPTLRSAMHAWSRTLSRPEPSLALLDAGKRDIPYDEGLAVPQKLSTGEPVKGELIALNDQHAFLRVAADDATVSAGAVVRLGLSHPCTAFDKWKLIPVIDNADSKNPRIVDLVHTFF
jgi:D-serine deaminase-like pyridoxal phosphate-dependent protein